MVNKLKIGDKVEIINKNKVWNNDVGSVPNRGVIDKIRNSGTTGFWYSLEGDDIHRFYPESLKIYS